MIYPNFRINNQELPQPTTHKWILPDLRGIDGFGNERFDPYYSYSLKYGYLSQEEYYSGVFRIWQGHYMSGAADCLLPGHQGYNYGFTYYTGVIMDRPKVGEYYQNFVKDVEIIIRKINIGV